jgi:hypothetical protein
MARTKLPKPTAADYLLMVADQNHDEYASRFRDMIAAGASKLDPVLVGEMVAARPLNEYEAAPVGIILAAADTALKHGGRAAWEETLTTGLRMLAKWPEYLCIQQLHPALECKQL